MTGGYTLDQSIGEDVVILMVDRRGEVLKPIADGPPLVVAAACLGAGVWRPRRALLGQI